MRAQLWCRAFGAAAEASAVELSAALTSAGYRVETFSPRATTRYGVIVAALAARELRSFVADASRCGRDRVLVVTPAPEAADAVETWRILEAGASDVLRWRGRDGSRDDVVARVERWREVDDLLDSPRVRLNLIGTGARWTRLLRHVVEVATFGDASVLLLGETGTGKELVARLIHTLDPRVDRGELIVVDCGNIVPGLAGSEFFGHERGAFTGASAARQGAFELADGGTLFLDEVGELPLDLQAQLLRVIQEGKFKRVGGNTWFDSRFRLICATHRDLAEQVTRGGFRPDLYYRIAAVTCRLPSLRERPEDIIPLAVHFLRDGRSATSLEFDPTVLDLIAGRSYPGNVRDLRQLVRRIVGHHVGNGPITVGDVPSEERPPATEPRLDWRACGLRDAIRAALACGVQLEEIGRVAKEVAIREALAEEDGNLQRAARRLGVTDRALQLRVAARRQDAASMGGEPIA